ncbi:hypothetical protein J8V57_16270, partial [Xenorhabdus sp. PB61.4]|uniref:hypothetical protein n=1 Tax=Xenorhabdus sp. PB61.4 TaxID=2788940 RepID=UPI001E513DD8
MVNSRSNYPSGDGSPSSLSSSTCYIENDCKIPYDSESMKLIRIARLRNIMKKAGMNENYEPDQDKIIKIFAYHNQILEFIENNDKCINISYNLAPTINGQTNINLFYYIIMGISFSG